MAFGLPVLLALVLGAGGGRVHLKGLVEGAVVDPEGPLLQQHAGLKAVPPQNLLLRVGCPGLTRHACRETRTEMRPLFGGYFTVTKKIQFILRLLGMY